MTKIKRIAARKILDSRGNPTVEVEVFSGEGEGRAAAPSGASSGQYEARPYPGKGIDFAIRQFAKMVTPRLVGADCADQAAVDGTLREIDGTQNFLRIGGALATATSLANAKAAAAEKGVPLYRYLAGRRRCRMPVPFGNILGGGRHAVGGTDIQEYLAVPSGGSFAGRAFANARAHKLTGKMIREARPEDPLGKGDEGAWVARLGNIDALNLVARACAATVKETGLSIGVALDVAASELFKDGVYHHSGTTMKPGEMVDYIASLVERFGLVSVEDPLEENDYEGFAELTRRVGKRCLIVGDDLFVTNPGRIKEGIRIGAANTVLIKVNQIGTLSDTIEAMRLAHAAGYRTIVSHRSGETEDAAIAHVAVGLGAYGIKTGTVGGERTAKLNELIRIAGDIE